MPTGDKSIGFFDIKKMIREFTLFIKNKFKNEAGAKAFVMCDTRSEIQGEFFIIYDGDSIIDMIPIEWIEKMVSKKVFE